jgi:hypothetical protein
MSTAPRERLGWGPWQRFPRNAVFFAALLANVVLALNLWSIVPVQREGSLAFVERTLQRGLERKVGERKVVEHRLSTARIYALFVLVGLLTLVSLAVTPTLFGKESGELRWGGRALALIPPLMLGLMLYGNWYRAGGA